MAEQHVLTVTVPAPDLDLTDLATTKDELGIATGDTTNDTWLGRGVSQISKAVSTHCDGRVFQVQAYSELIFLDRAHHSVKVRDRKVIQLEAWPTVLVSSVIEDVGLESQQTLVAGTDYLLRSKTSELIRLDDQGQPCPWRVFSVTVSYVAGYGAVVTETDAIPASPGPYTITVDEADAFSIDQGVSFVGAAALVPVASGPASGQYAVDVDTGVYTFAAADTGKQVAISYGYNEIPLDLVAAVLRMITLRWTAKARDPMLMEKTQPGGVGTERYWIPAGQEGAFPPEITGMLDSQYRVPVTA